MTERARSAHPLVELTRARLLTMIREPELVFWVFVFPILMAVALGVAFRAPAEPVVTVGVVASEGDGALLEALADHPGVTPFAIAAADADVALRDGEAQLVVVPGRPPTYRYDPTRPESRAARLLVDGLLQDAAGRHDVWQAPDDLVVAPGSRYIDWLIPGLLGMNIMGTGMWATGFTVVVQRSRKLLKRLAATPMRRAHYLGSLIAARLVFLGLEVVTLVGFAWLVFGIPIEGSIVTLGLVALAGAMTFGGIGLLVSARARTVEGVSGLMNIVMVPMWIASGVFFAASNFPDPLQPLIQALPLTALVDALRGVMLAGDGVGALAGELGILAGWGASSFGLALRLFTWR